jgi:hypothetical protein
MLAMMLLVSSQVSDVVDRSRDEASVEAVVGFIRAGCGQVEEDKGAGREV